MKDPEVLISPYLVETLVFQPKIDNIIEQGTMIDLIELEIETSILVFNSVVALTVSPTSTSSSNSYFPSGW